MRTLRFFLLSVMMFASMSCSGESGTENQGAVQKEIEQVISSAWDALSSQDLDLFNRYVRPDWQLYTARGNKMDAETLFGMHRQNIRNFALESSNMNIEQKGDIAWVTYDAEMSGLARGEEWGGSFILTNILVRVNGEWKIAHMHESLSQ